MNDLVVARRYRIGRRIGAGGMGRVWLAMDEVLRREVAIKEVLLPDGLTDDDAAELRLRTLREARTAGKVSHPNVIKVYDVIYAENRPWIVMEYVESRSLAQVIKDDGPMPPEDAARIGISILAALVAAHDAGVLHRDVKPGNVLLGAKRVVLTDFGLATFDDIGSALTASGVVHGSPQFIAPERALDGTSTTAADMWSLGATLYAAVEGRAPYARASSYATLTALATAPPDPPRHAGVLKPVLHGLLRRNPDARMKADEVRAWLRQIADGDGDSPTRIPRQRRNVDPNPSAGSGPTGSGSTGSGSTGSNGSGSSGSGSAGSGSSSSTAAATGQRSTTRPATAPVSHARRNRRPAGGNPAGANSTGANSTGNPNERKRTTPAPTTRSHGPETLPPVEMPVAGGAPPAVGPKPPPGFASANAALVNPAPQLDHDTDHEMDLAWQLNAAAGVLDNDAADRAQEVADAQAAWRRNRRSRKRVLTWLTAVVCVMAAATGGAFTIRHLRDGNPGTSPHIITPIPGGTGAAGGKISWPCPATPTSKPSGAVPALKPGESNTATLGATPYTTFPGWRWFTVNGFTTMAPITWLIHRGAGVTCFYEPSDVGVLGFQTLLATNGSALDVLKAQAAKLVDGDGRSGYSHQSFGQPNLGISDAELDFNYTETYAGRPTPMAAMEYLVQVSAHRMYEFFWTSRQLDWTNRSNFDQALEVSLLVAPK